jgi:hypothetical protein
MVSFVQASRSRVGPAVGGGWRGSSPSNWRTSPARCAACGYCAAARSSGQRVGGVFARRSMVSTLRNVAIGSALPSRSRVAIMASMS